MPRGRVLVVDDDSTVRTVLCDLLEEDGFAVKSAKSAEEALQKVNRHRFDLVITDVRMTGIDGLELQRRVKASQEHTEVVIITGYGDIPMSVRAMREGAFEFLTKPFASIDQVVMVARRAVEKAQMAAELERLSTSSLVKDGLDELVGRSPKMQVVYQKIEQLARTDSTVLLLGETGSGKEITARAIHKLGRRKRAPFIAINCGSLPESLLESELFGHTKGAFTGASCSKIGLFAAASGGSILLDEIEAAQEHTQVSLLRVLDTKEVRPIGSSKTQRVDVRVFASSNQDLETLVEEGRFRKDLYFRLISAIITLPPLRERPGDIPLLAEYFVRLHCKAHNKPLKRFSPSALEALCRYSWPGNVRELKHAVEHGVIFSNSPLITLKNLPESIASAHGKSQTPFPTLEEIERDHIQQALRLAGFNKAKAARMLGLTRQSLYRKLERYCLQPDPVSDR